MADLTLTPKNIRPLSGSTVSLHIAGAILTIGDVVYIDSNDEAQRASAANAATVSGQVGVIVACGANRDNGNIQSGEPVTVLWHGRLALTTGTLSPVARYYVSDNPGKLADAAGSTSRIVGSAEKKDILFFDGSPS
jgi:hypothetical protein